MQKPFHETHLSSSHGTNCLPHATLTPPASPHFLIGKLGRAKIRRNPGATEHEDGVEERLARARETEREKAMVFLDVLVNYGCRRWLHKEDYSFE